MLALQEPTAQVRKSIIMTAVIHAQHESDLYGRMARRKTFLKKIQNKSNFHLVLSHIGDTVIEGALITWVFLFAFIKNPMCQKTKHNEGRIMLWS